MHVKTDYGWVWMYSITYKSLAKPANLTVGMYDDSVDDIQETDDIGAITTRPGGASYSDASIATVDTDLTFEAGRWQVTGPDVPFDTHDSGRHVDSFFLTDEFQASGDSSATEHLLLTGALGDDIDLSPRASYTMRGYGEVDSN